MIAGSPLTSLSLLGPNPGLGVRFYGIGNELEALLSVLVVAGTGAALAGFAPGAAPRRAALAFLATGLLFAFVFAAGRFGADVGAAIVLPLGAAVAAAAIVAARRRRTLLLALAAPVAAVALLALIDLALRRQRPPDPLGARRRRPRRPRRGRPAPAAALRPHLRQADRLRLPAAAGGDRGARPSSGAIAIAAWLPAVPAMRAGPGRGPRRDRASAPSRTTPAASCSRSAPPSCWSSAATPGPRRATHAAVTLSRSVRIALVSPYSWSYQGGVNRHVEALAEEFLGRGHHVRVLAPFDPPGRLSRLAHRAAPEPREMPDYLIPLGRTIGIAANGAVSNLSALAAGGISTRAASCAAGDYDVVHIHEPLVPLVGWNAALGSARPGGRHLPHLLDQGAPQPHRARRSAPGASSTGSRRGSPSPRPPPGPAGAGSAAATRSSPTASTSPPPRPGRSRPRRSCGSLFVGRAEERKGLPILLSAFGALTEHVPCRLTVIGAEREEVPALSSPTPRRCASSTSTAGSPASGSGPSCTTPTCSARPRSSGESFGMVLTEAFAAGTPVIASEIAGYSDVVSDGVDGVLVPPADPQRLAEELQRAHHEPERLREMGAAARRSAERYAWPHVADRVTEVYEQALEAPRARHPAERFGRWAGYRPADGASAGARPAPALARPAPGPAAAAAGAASRAASASASPPCSASA